MGTGVCKSHLSHERLVAANPSINVVSPMPSSYGVWVSTDGNDPNFFEIDVVAPLGNSRTNLRTS